MIWLTAAVGMAAGAGLFTVAELMVEQPRRDEEPPVVIVLLTLTGGRDLTPVTAALAELDGVLAVAADDPSVGGA